MSAIIRRLKEYHRLKTPKAPKEKIGLSIKDAAQLSSLGETSICEAIKDKRLRSRKFGTRVIITHNDLIAFLEALPVE
jgi:excisionase family DNA binding protein